MTTALIIFIFLFLLTLAILILVTRGAMADQKILKAKLEAVQADRNNANETLKDIEISREKHETTREKIDASKDGDLFNIINSYFN